MKESSCAQTNKFVLATLSCARALLHHHASKNLRPQEGAERRKAHANHCRRASKRAHLRHSSAFGAAARSFGARSPSGALLRHSPGRTHPPLAQLQFPRFLRPDLTGVTRFDLSQVYRAPRRPVVMPVERWPRAARERMANPPAGTAPAPLFRHAFRKGALNERGSGYVTEIETNVKKRIDISDNITCDFSAIDERVNCTHMRLQVETLDDALLQLYPELLLRGNHVAASRGENTEILGVLIEIERPRARLSRSETSRKGV